MDIPKLERYITDFTDTLTVDELNELEAIAENYHNKTTNQLVAVVIPDRQGRELFDIGMKIFNDNGIGNKEVNNGLLLLIANNEQKIRIVVGYGLEDEIPDLKASQIIEKSIRPLVNEGQLFEAIKTYYIEGQKAIDGSKIDTSRQEKAENFLYHLEKGWEASDFIILVAFILGLLTGWTIRFLRPLLFIGKIRSMMNGTSWLGVLIGMGILRILWGGTAVLVYLMGVWVGLGIIKLKGWGGSWWGSSWWGSSWWGSSGWSSWWRSSGWSSGWWFGGFSGWGGRSGGGGAGD